MANPTIKIPTKAISMRFPRDVALQLLALAEKRQQPQVQVVNSLIREAYQKTIIMEETE